MRAWLGLGGNQGDPVARLGESLERLARAGGIELLQLSSFYRTPPWGEVAQDDFINAVAKVETSLEPIELLAVTRSIEDDMGRRRDARRWGPRIIDIDLLLYGDGPFRAGGLEIPHPRMHERAFVLVPLAELDPDLAIPGRGRVSELLEDLDCAGIRKLDDEEMS
jgi:2-amino-4-hydroxy-6-hydroxymethyldihydropteridine diphosphokinase